jgi:dGTPase
VGDIVREVSTRFPGLESGRTIHETIRRLIDRLVGDLVDETGRRLASLAPNSVEDIRRAGRPVVALSTDLLASDKVLRAFLTERLYRDYRVNRMTSKARRIVQDLFNHFMAEPETLPTPWQGAIRAADSGGAGQARIIADYIAGMTDRYAVAEHQRLFDLHERNQ